MWEIAWAKDENAMKIRTIIAVGRRRALERCSSEISASSKWGILGVEAAANACGAMNCSWKKREDRTEKWNFQDGWGRKYPCESWCGLLGAMRMRRTGDGQSKYCTYLGWIIRKCNIIHTENTWNEVWEFSVRIVRDTSVNPVAPCEQRTAAIMDRNSDGTIHGKSHMQLRYKKEGKIYISRIPPLLRATMLFNLNWKKNSRGAVLCQKKEFYEEREAKKHKLLSRSRDESLRASAHSLFVAWHLVAFFSLRKWGGNPTHAAMRNSKSIINCASDLCGSIRKATKFTCEELLATYLLLGCPECWGKIYVFVLDLDPRIEKLERRMFRIDEPEMFALPPLKFTQTYVNLPPSNTNLTVSGIAIN